MALILRRSTSLAVLLAVLLVAIAVGIALGSVTLPLRVVLAALAHPHASGDVAAIVWALRSE
jgi:hypothetical protein